MLKLEAFLAEIPDSDEVASLDSLRLTSTPRIRSLSLKDRSVLFTLAHSHANKHAVADSQRSVKTGSNE